MRIRAVLVLAACCSLAACKKKETPAAKPTAPAAAAAKADVGKRLAKFAPVDFSVDLSKLTAAEREALSHLRRATDAIDRIFWVQVGEAALRLRTAARAAGEPVSSLFEIMYGPWDRLLHHEAFFGGEARPAGAGFYPKDLTKAELLAYFQANPGEKTALESPYTVVRREGKKLVAVPYREAYAAELKIASEALLAAAAKVPDVSLAKFLNGRAKALLSDDYFDSECDWMDVGESRIDVTFGPYEVYEDTLLGQKTAFEAIIGLRDEAATKALDMYKQNLGMLDAALPIDPKHRGRRAVGSPIIAINKIYAGGDARKGVSALAFNLPNDEKVRAKKGSKKVMLKNVSQAKFDKILRPIAARLLDATQAPNIDFETFFNQGLMHEMSHGMGPGILMKGGKETTVSKELRELYPAIEEAKADVVGLFSTKVLLDKGLLGKDRARFVYPSYVAGLMRSIRFGAAEAHGKANALQLTFLEQEGAVQFDEMAGRFRADEAKFPAAIEKLARALLVIEGEGDYAAAKAFLAKYGKVAPHVVKALAGLGELPVDIAPKYPAF